MARYCAAESAVLAGLDSRVAPAGPPQLVHNLTDRCSFQPGGGGKLLLLFREARYRHLEGAAALADATACLADLARRVGETEARKRRRLDETHVVLASVGALEDEARSNVV